MVLLVQNTHRMGIVSKIDRIKTYKKKFYLVRGGPLGAAATGGGGPLAAGIGIAGPLGPGIGIAPLLMGK